MNNRGVCWKILIQNEGIATTTTMVARRNQEHNKKKNIN